MKPRTGNIAETSFQQWPYILLASLSLVRKPLLFISWKEKTIKMEEERKNVIQTWISLCQITSCMSVSLSSSQMVSKGLRWLDLSFDSASLWASSHLFATFLSRSLESVYPSAVARCQTAWLGLFSTSYAVGYFEPTSVRVAPEWELWRTLYWLSYGAVALQFHT